MTEGEFRQKVDKLLVDLLDVNYPIYLSVDMTPEEVEALMQEFIAIANTAKLEDGELG